MSAHVPIEAELLPWITVAKGELGVTELVKGRANPRIHEYFQATGFKAGDASTAWCSAFANWCMKQAGRKGTGKAAARSWLSWGTELPEPMFGCVVVFSRDSAGPGSGHVGFYVGESAGFIQVLGGNQNNQVCVRSYVAHRLLGCRWPSE